MKDKNVYFYLGILLAIISVILLLTHVRVGTFHFYRFGIVNTGAVCIILLLVSFISLLVKPCKITTFFFVFSIIALIIDIIISLHIYLVGMTFFNLLLILLPGCIGTALIIRSLLSE